MGKRKLMGPLDVPQCATRAGLSEVRRRETGRSRMHSSNSRVIPNNHGPTKAKVQIVPI